MDYKQRKNIEIFLEKRQSFGLKLSNYSEEIKLNRRQFLWKIIIVTARRRRRKLCCKTKEKIQLFRQSVAHYTLLRKIVGSARLYVHIKNGRQRKILHTLPEYKITNLRRKTTISFLVPLPFFRKHRSR